MLTLLIELLVLCLIVGIVYWAISQIPLPPPVRIAVNVIFALIVIVILLSFVGWGPVTWRHARW